MKPNRAVIAILFLSGYAAAQTRSAAPVAYRGIPIAAVADSLTRADLTLSRLALGPITTSRLELWRSLNPLATLSAAKTDVEAAVAMRRVGHHFRDYHDVFEHDALAELEDLAAHATARDLYRDLNAWGAFHGKSEERVDGEVQAHLAADNAHRLIGRLPGDKAVRERLSEAVESLASVDAQAATELPRLFTAALKASEKGRDWAARVFRRLGGQQRASLAEALRHSAGLLLGRASLAAPDAFDHYGIAVAPSTSDSHEIKRALGPVMDQTESALAPYAATDELGFRMIGGIGAGWSGYSFTGTRRAAQALADALPGHNIIDSKGRRLEPTPVKPSGEKEPGPSGSGPDAVSPR